MKQRVILIAAGGTGGHIFPGLAVAARLSEQGCRVEWLGSAGGMEVGLVSSRGIPVHVIHVAGIRGKGVLTLLQAPFSLLRALREAWTVLALVRPDCVLGMGGFAAGPGGVCAWLRRIPLVIHEQNAAAGVTNRLLARLARHVLCGFAGAFPVTAKVRHVGNPVRSDLLEFPPPAERELAQHAPMRVLVLGGSRGARIFNQLLPRVFSVLSQETPLQVVHQCGRGHAEDCAEEYRRCGVQARVSEFIGDMRAAYAATDLLVARAGALTLAEVTAVGVPAVLIPYPHAVDDHQTRNAQSLVASGAARLIPESEFDHQRAATVIGELLQQPHRLLDMAQAARKLAQPQAAEDVMQVCLEAMRK